MIQLIEKVSYQKSKSTIQAVENKCHRCMGNHLIISENEHTYCEECSLTRTMADFIYLNRYERTIIKKTHQLNLSFELSEPQKRGEKFLLDCYKEQSQGFLHAVCGAGKTEMCLSMILAALNDHKSVVFVIPRVEIIKQLVERFKNYFPKTHICGLYAENMFDESADLFVSTPQQLVKFYQEFDLMIIDEVDAFPFFDNTYLERLVNKSLKEKSTLIYISATMPLKYQKHIKANQFKYCLIPERFHQRDLILPEFISYKYIYESKIYQAIESYQVNRKKLLVYLPSIHLMSRFLYFLKSKSIACEMISSQTKYRQSLIKRFEKNDFCILLTTTLLERGVTFQGCDVFVLEADHHIFDKETLIQVSGRIDRSINKHQGKLVFYSRYVTKAMKKSRKEMIEMNHLKNNDL